MQKYIDILQTFFPLSIISFGGPTAHIALFMNTFVTKRQWLSEGLFTELFSMAQSLPGPASTQLAFSITFVKYGTLPAFVSFLIWSLPTMIIMTVIGFWISWVPAIHPQWIDRLTDSLAAGAVGLTASAAVMLSAKLVSNSVGIVLAFIGMAGGIFSETKAWMLPLLLFFGGITSVLMNMPLFTASEPHQERLALLNVEQESATEMKHVSKKISIGFGLIWIVFLVIALIGQTIHDNIFMQLFSTFYLIGTLIFGGGPVVIPMIQGFMGQHGWMTDNEFMAGLAVISLLPGPMFNISAFCGTIALRNLSPLYRVIGAIISWLAIFSPGLFLKVMILPFWQTYRSLRLLQIFFNGVNAIAVGLVYGSVYLLSDKNLLSNSKPLMHSPKYVIISGFAFVAFGPLKMPAPLVVLLSGVLGMLPYW